MERRSEGGVGWGLGKESKGQGVMEREGVRGVTTTDQRFLVSGLFLYDIF